MYTYTVSYEWMSEDVHVCGLSVFNEGDLQAMKIIAFTIVGFFSVIITISNCKINLYNTKTLCKHDY